jgi:single-strand DNA-binding protein
MSSMHEVELIGNLGRDPEARNTNSGTLVCNFSVATTRKYTANNQPVEETAWFRVSTFGKLAEVCNQYLGKGRKVRVTGRLSVDPQTGGPKVFQKQDGTMGSAFEVIASDVMFLDSARNGNGTAEPQPETATEDIPF